MAIKQYKFGCLYSNIDPKTGQAYKKGNVEKDLNYDLYTFCELKYHEVCTEDNVRARKWEMK